MTAGRRCRRVAMQGRSGELLRALVALLALGAHLWLPALAFASPPDPIDTTSGYFDDDDFDDIVLTVMAMHAVVEPAPRLEPLPTPVHATEPRVHPMGPPVDPARPPSIRAPPAT